MKNKKSLIAAAVLAAVVATDVMAGTDTSFNSVVTKLDDWTTGSLGKTFALGSLGVGLAVGVVKQSIMSVVTGVAVALSASIGPGVLQGLFSATL